MADRVSYEEQLIAGKSIEQVQKIMAAAGKRLATELNDVDDAAEGRSWLDSIGQHIEAAGEYEANWGKMQGLSSGYKAIDELTHGFCPGELIVLGGYTSRGKTQLAVNITHRVAQRGTPVLFVTLEMTKPMLTSRFLRLGAVGPETPIFYQTADVIEPSDMDAVIARAKGDGCGFVVIDHLHYFARGSDMLGKVGEVTRDFKRLAVKYELPILLLSQLRRPERAGKSKLAVPSLNDLKESGYIEQDADIVLMVHRDMPEDNPDENLSTDFSRVVIAQRKNRNRGMTARNPLAVLEQDQENGVLLAEHARFIGQ